MGSAISSVGSGRNHSTAWCGTFGWGEGASLEQSVSDVALFYEHAISREIRVQFTSGVSRTWLLIRMFQLAEEMPTYRWQNHVYGLYLFHKPA
jgi:hypothetical protein